MPKFDDSLVTIVGSAYFAPIATLIDKLASSKRTRPNRLQVGPVENGYSAACVLLLVAMFESFASRLRFDQGGMVATSHRSAAQVIVAVFPRLRHQKALADVYVLRDLLIHAHLWKIDYRWGGSSPMQFVSAKLDPAYGDAKFKARVNVSTHRTKALRLSIFPSRIDRVDVLKVFDTIWKTLLVAEQKNGLSFRVSTMRVQFRKQYVLFSSLRDTLHKSIVDSRG